MNIELLGQFGQRLVTSHGSQSHLRLECRRMVPAWSFAHRLSCSAAILAAVRQKHHLSDLFKNPEPALLGRTSVTYAVGIFKQGGAFAAAQGHFVHVYVDRATQRPVDIPSAVRTKLEALIPEPQAPLRW